MAVALQFWLKSPARRLVELQDLVQAKVGTTKFSFIYNLNQIRQSALGIQRKRKVARALQETINHKAAAKRKIQMRSRRIVGKGKIQDFFMSYSLNVHLKFLIFFSDGKRKVKRPRED